jgi:Kef-type K+ transport system membrane component KefB
LFFPWEGFSPRRGLQAGLLLSSRLSLIVAAASIGSEQGYLSAATKDSIVLLALITCLLGPTLFRLSTKRSPLPKPRDRRTPQPPRAGL